MKETQMVGRLAHHLRNGKACDGVWKLLWPVSATQQDRTSRHRHVAMSPRADAMSLHFFRRSRGIPWAEQWALLAQYFGHRERDGKGQKNIKDGKKHGKIGRRGSVRESLRGRCDCNGAACMFIWKRSNYTWITYREFCICIGCAPLCLHVLQILFAGTAVDSLCVV